MKKPKPKRMWGGRFRRAPAEVAEEFSRSLGFDRRLAPYDIAASAAHARALGRAGVLSRREVTLLSGSLERLRASVLSGKADFDTGEEDIHTWVENRLREKAGAAADKLHAGRSRNDQVVQDLRLYLRDETERTAAGLRGLKGALIDLAEKYLGEVTAGHTHFQPAQPVLLSHHLLAYFEMLQRDSERFRGILPRIAVLTLGSGALAGTAIPLDRRLLARDLGLPGITRNSIDAVSDRDFAVEFTAAAALTMVHLSRLGEEIIIWSHPALGWAEIAEELCTGSSLMPQKRNPDLPELVRGKTGRTIGHLTGLLALLKGLPLAYNRDLQEDKEALFDTVDTLRSSLEVMTAVAAGLRFRPERLGEAARSGFSTATDLAEFLALKGVPFRRAHHLVGTIIRSCLDSGRTLEDLTARELRKFSPHFGPEAVKVLTAAESVRRKRVPGGTSPVRVRAALTAARKRNK